VDEEIDAVTIRRKIPAPAAGPARLARRQRPDDHPLRPWASAAMTSSLGATADRCRPDRAQAPPVKQPERPPPRRLPPASDTTSTSSSRCSSPCRASSRRLHPVTPTPPVRPTAARADRRNLVSRSDMANQLTGGGTVQGENSAWRRRRRSNGCSRTHRDPLRGRDGAGPQAAIRRVARGVIDASRNPDAEDRGPPARRG
jgi:hypothetical protein